MCKRILSASISVQEGKWAQKLRFASGINILCGKNAEDAVLSLAGIFGGMPPQNGKAKIQWDTDAVLFVSITDGACGVEGSKPQNGRIAQNVKAFHKQRFLNYDNRTHILDGSDLPAGFLGAGDLLLKKLGDALAQEDDRPLFVYNFLERLDESIDLQPIFEALLATGRQVFVAVPHYYKIEKLEGEEYGATIHYESNL